MSIALSEFWTRLVRSGITDAAGCKLLAAAFSEANAGTPPTDSSALARFMIQAGRLTQFQAEALLADQPREIRAGRFVIQSDALPPPLSRWVRASRVEDGQSGILLRASAEQLAGGRMPWLEAHQTVNSPTLQPIEIESHATATLVFSPLPEGRPIHDLVGESGSLSAREACEVGIAVAQALEVLHARALIHGSVRPDRVWMSADGPAILLRDPSGPPLTPRDDTSAGWLDVLSSPASYAAPEFAGGGQACDQATDIYSLGCLIFRLATGRNPYDKDTPAATMAAHASETPPELAEAVARGESGDPLFRVVAFAMAKSPAARFATAEQLSGALSATLPLLSKPAPTTEAVNASRPPTVEEAAAAKVKQRKPSQTKSPTSKSPTSKRPTSKRPAPSPARGAVKAKGTAPAAGTDPTSKPKPDREVEPRGSMSSEPKPPATPRSDQPIDASGSKSKRATTAALAAAAKETPPPVSPAAEPARPPAGQPSPPAAQPPRAAQPPPTPQPSPPAATASPPPAEVAATAADVGDEGSPGRGVRRRRKKKTKAPLVLGAMCVVVLMLVIGLVVHDPNASVAEKKTRPPIPDVIPRVSNRLPPKNETATEEPVVESVVGYELVTDDRLLFVPPYAADTETAPLGLLPPGPRIIISVRLASMMRSPLGDAFAPELDGLIKSVASRSKVQPESIDRCTLAMYPGKEGWPEVCLAIELNESQPASELIEKWQVSASRTADGATVYAGDEVDADAYYFPNDEGESISRFAVGSVPRISEVAAGEGGAIPLTRTFQALWDKSSDQADLVALITPNFLFADGRELLRSSVPELTQPLKSVIQPDVAAALVTMHTDGPRVYIESRLAPSGGISEAALMRAISESVQAWPAWADEFIVDSVADASWRLLAARLPSMMRFVNDHIRFGISDGTVVANTYLPAQAASQVTLATVLAMNTPSSGGAAVAKVQPTRALTVDEMLDRKMSVSFDQQSLEFAIDEIVTAFKESLPAGSTMPPVRIVGGDLQLMGITQNQQVRDFEKSDLPLRTVLTDLVLGANPDKSATGPKDPKQALIWVVAEDSDSPGNKVILVTTRQAAQGKYDLPREFQPSN